MSPLPLAKKVKLEQDVKPPCLLKAPLAAAAPRVDSTPCSTFDPRTGRFSIDIDEAPDHGQTRHPYFVHNAQGAHGGCAAPRGSSASSSGSTPITSRGLTAADGILESPAPDESTHGDGNRGLDKARYNSCQNSLHSVKCSTVLRDEWENKIKTPSRFRSDTHCF